MTRPARLAAILAALSVAAPAVGSAQTPDAQTPDAQAPAAQAPDARTPAAQLPDASMPNAQAPGDQAPAAQAPGAQTANPQTPNRAPVEAQTQVYYSAGSWDAFSGRGDAGGPVCGVGSTNPANRHVLSLRFDIGGRDTTFIASKPGWSIPDGTQVAVVMQLGLDAPWTLRGTGRGPAIQWTLDRDAIQDFDRQFRGAAQMTLSFPDGNEPPWTVSLAGSTVISNTFGRCITDLTRQVQATQPPAAAAAPVTTQPFGAPGGAPPAR